MFYVQCLQSSMKRDVHTLIHVNLFKVAHIPGTYYRPCKKDLVDPRGKEDKK
jgi:hypothetical protein